MMQRCIAFNICNIASQSVSFTEKHFPNPWQSFASHPTNPRPYIVEVLLPATGLNQVKTSFNLDTGLP